MVLISDNKPFDIHISVLKGLFVELKTVTVSNYHLRIIIKPILPVLHGTSEVDLGRKEGVDFHDAEVEGVVWNELLQRRIFWQI